MRKLTEIEAKVFNFLNNLRDSGKVNMFSAMFGARPYIIKTFGTGEKKSSEILILWMKNFEESREWNESDEIKA